MRIVNEPKTPQERLDSILEIADKHPMRKHSKTLRINGVVNSRHKIANSNPKILVVTFEKGPMVFAKLKVSIEEPDDLKVISDFHIIRDCLL